MIMGKEKTNVSTMRKGGILNNIEYLTENLIVKGIKGETKNKRIYLIFEDEFVKFKPSKTEYNKVIIKDCPQGAKIDYRLYGNLPGEVKVIFINLKNKGLEQIIQDIEDYIKTLPEDCSEIIGIGKGIGGVLASVLPEFFEKKGMVRIITIATPYWGIEPASGFSRKKFIPETNELLRQLFWKDFFNVAQYSLEGIKHINCITDDIQKVSYTITSESQQIPEESYTERKDLNGISSIEEATREVIKMLSPDLLDDEIIILEL